jgi:hypothetical protein
MAKEKQIDLRKRIGIFYQNNKNLGKTFTVNHFKLEKVHKSLVYRVINKIDNGISLERKPVKNSSRNIPKKIKEKIIEESVLEVGRSYRWIGRKYKIDGKTAKKILVESGVNRKKRRKAPKSNDNQRTRQKKCLEKLRRKILMPSNDIEIVMDDESYFTLDGSNSYGNDYYYSYEGLEPPENVKYLFRSKFPPKVMVWLAISNLGISQPFITSSGLAINSKIYIKECVNKKLIKFLKKFHSDQNFIFWPDLASSHYENDTLAEFERLNIKIVPKDSNPPNVPQLRPIERFWTTLKRNVYRNGWTAKSVQDLVKRIKTELKKIPLQSCQNLMRGLKTKIRKAADRGALSLID